MIKSKFAMETVDFGNNKSNPRSGAVLGITPHHMAGRMLGKDCAKSHLYSSRQASANYYIGYKGDICAGVSEDRRAWTSGSRANDMTHITIEVSNSAGAPEWQISDAAYAALVNLCADICQRYGIVPHFSGTAEGSITYHQQFQNTNCPGPYLKRLIDSGEFENDIKKAMGQPSQPEPVTTLYRVQVGAFRNKSGAVDTQRKLQDAGHETYIVKKDGLYKVQLGAFRNKSNAERLQQIVKEEGYDAFITTESGEAVKDTKGRKSDEEIADEVIRGEWGNDPDRRRKLTAAGYDAAKIQKIVNNKLK